MESSGTKKKKEKGKQKQNKKQPPQSRMREDGGLCTCEAFVPRTASGSVTGPLAALGANLTSQHVPQSFCFCTRVTGLLESSTRLKPHEAQNYRKKALWVSWLSIIVTLALAVAAFTVSVMRYSASAFGFAFDAILDVLSSAIVLWRYSNAAAVHSANREYIACVILGVIFLLSSICIVVKAIHDLSTRLLPEVDDFLFSVSILSGILCSVLAVLKFMLGKVLTSRALITDGFNSLVGGVMGFSILLSAEVFKHNAAVWYLDGSIGVLIGLTIFAYGVKLLIDMVPRVRQTRHYEMFE
eukprot:XP_011246389.1 PREDICTED: transmembrane protein 163 isoform X1 [Mus musculus]